MRPGYYRIGSEAVAFWPSASDDPRIDINPATRRPYALAWRSDYATRPGKPVVMVDADDGAEMAALAADPALRAVTLAEWVAFQRTGTFEDAA